MSRKKRWIVFSLAMFAVAFSIIMAYLLIWECPGTTFDKDTWKEQAQVEKGVRLGMADRLVAQGTLLGKMRAEIVELLGEPPPTGYFRNWDLVYWLGRERGFMSIDSEWLVFRFTDDGHCGEYRIVRD